MPQYDPRLGPGPSYGGFPSLGPAPTTGPATNMHPEMAGYNQQLQGQGFRQLQQPRQMGGMERLMQLLKSLGQGPESGGRQVQLGSY